MAGRRRLARSPNGPVSSKNEPPRLFPVSYKVLKNQPNNSAPRTRCTAVRTAALLFCCMEQRFGLWVGGGCTASSVGGGWAVLYVRVFLRPVGDEPFFLFPKYRPPAGAWEHHRPHCCTPLSFTTVRTAALLLQEFCSFNTDIQRMIPLLPYVLLHCRTALLLFCYFST